MQPIYFDNAASTPPLPEALSRLGELNNNVYGNSTSNHVIGRRAHQVYEESASFLGKHFRVPPSHIIFTSGGTESNNLAIWGALGGLAQAALWLRATSSSRVLTSDIEHPATSKVFTTLDQLGADVHWLPVDNQGLLRLEVLEDRLDFKTRLLSIHHAQNEIGVLQDLRSISQIVRQKSPDALIHIDAIQSFLKTPCELEDLGVDLLSISAHKFGGPKGIGAVVLGKRFESRVPKVGPLLLGSSQQHSMRPGTVPVPLIGSMVTAIETGLTKFEANRAKLLQLRTRLSSQLPSRIAINGPLDVSASSPRRVPQTLNFSIPGLPSGMTMEALSQRGFCVSAGSACSSANPKPNETLLKMGVSHERALSPIRVSFSPSNTFEEVDKFCGALEDVIRQYG